MKQNKNRMTIRGKSKGCRKEIKPTCADYNTLFLKDVVATSELFINSLDVS
ncbi:uncharacterized protein LOC110230812 [Arabidopsis lyrata subsp. lyrata]|uniref:uncharacterized protein LOC110230812 n=1 Tax=Arabidopsis lyrata subsp. lyrata TaxID=81972 RepID=UPI000A29D3A3|nr:uncharacterized protein LOC110230812 [Arabidopsis lyrata subsp. lyrata]|eukprot:XP_020890484.1 uncharacterized protein LOC110230812 [Arabidopsis lyrata subsp. lyrata]